MAVGDVSRRERTDEEPDEKVADDRRETELPKAEADERRAEKDDADLEDGDRVRHERSLAGGGAPAGKIERRHECGPGSESQEPANPDGERDRSKDGWDPNNEACSGDEQSPRERHG